MESNENSNKAEIDIKVEIQRQLRDIINANDSIWIIAIKSFELGKKH